MRKIELKIGEVFDCLTVVKGLGTIGGHWRYLCLCNCGKEAVASGSKLKAGTHTSCGNCGFEHEYPSEYKAYWHAKERCTDETHKQYKHYGGRGIKFLLPPFRYFLIHLGAKPHPSLTLDRIDNEGHYEFGNLRWATRKQQANNTRRNRKHT